MTGRVRIVTDSNTMIPWSRVDELDIVVVPLTVTIGGQEMIEDRASFDCGDDRSPESLARDMLGRAPPSIRALFEPA